MIPHIFLAFRRLLIMHSFSFVTALSLSSPVVVFHVLHTSLAATTHSTVASVLVPLCYHDYMSATRQPLRVTRSLTRAEK